MKYEVNNILDIATYHHDNKTGIKLLVRISDNRYCKITVPEIDFNKASLEEVTQDSYTISDEPWHKTIKIMQGITKDEIVIPIQEDPNTHQLFTVEDWDK